MKQLTLKHDGTERQISAPDTLEEMPLSVLVGILTECELGEAKKEPQALIMARVVMSAFELTEAEVMATTSDDLETLYMMAMKPIMEYKPTMEYEVATVSHKGETYLLPSCLVSGESDYRLTVNEYINLEEALRLSEAAKSPAMREYAETGDKDAAQKYINALFTEYCEILAVLLRKPGEILPLDAAERDQFLAQRKMHFQDVKAKTAMDAAFFLNARPNRYGKITDFTGTLMRLTIMTIMTLTHQNSQKGKPALKGTGASLESASAVNG